MCKVNSNSTNFTTNHVEKINMCYGTTDCPKCEGSGRIEVIAADNGKYNGPIGETIKIECDECGGEGWVDDPDVVDVCPTCGGAGDVRVYHGDCDVATCYACKGTGRGCYGMNHNAPEKCLCERCTDYLTDRDDVLYHQMKENGHGR